MSIRKPAFFYLSLVTAIAHGEKTNLRKAIVAPNATLYRHLDRNDGNTTDDIYYLDSNDDGNSTTYDDDGSNITDDGGNITDDKVNTIDNERRKTAPITTTLLQMIIVMKYLKEMQMIGH